MKAVIQWVAAVFLSPLAIGHLEESMQQLHTKIDAIADRLRDVETEMYQRWRD